MRLFRLAVLIAAGALLSGSVLAQPPRGAGGGGGGFGGGGFGGGGFGGRMPGGMAMMLSFNKQLQDELKMDKEQVEKLNEAMTKVRDEMRDKLRDTAPDQIADMLKKMAEANTKVVNSVLKPEQQKRLQQIENQQAGLGMYLKEDVQKTLKLSDEQKSKIETINADLQKDLRELRGGFGDPQIQRKRQSLTKEAKESVEALLSDDQKTLVKSLLGEPFEMRQGGFAAGGFGGGGGGGGGFGGGGFGGGGFGGFSPPAQPGQIMSTAIQDRLKLTDEQKKQMQELQKDVDAKLEKILSEEQRKQLKDMGQGAGRGGRRGRGGAGGQGGPGGDR